MSNYMSTHIRRDDLEALREINRSLEEHSYLVYSGQAKPQFRELLSSWKELIRDLWNKLRKAFKEKPYEKDPLRKEVLYLYTLLETAALEDELSSAMAEPFIPWKGSEKVSVYTLSHLMKSSDDPKEREEAEEELLRAYEKLWNLKEAIWEAHFRVASNLLGDGKPHPRAYLEVLKAVKGVDYESLRKSLGEVLKLRDLLLTFLRETQGFTPPIPKHQLLYHLSSKRDISWDPQALVIEVFKGEVIPDSLSLDLEDRPAKNPRAACFPITPGKDVRITLRPTGSLDDIVAFFHELGHGLHYGYFGYLHPEVDWKNSLSLNGSITETFAFLMEYSFLDPDVFKSLGLPFSKSDLLKAWAYQLFLIIRYIAKLDFEVKWLSSNSLDTPRKLYSDTLTELTGVRYHPQEAIFDIDFFIYSADYLRAWVTERALQNFLRKSSWPHHETTFKLLVPIWSEGNLLDVTDLLGKFNLTFSTSPLISWYENLFSSYGSP